MGYEVKIYCGIRHESTPDPSRDLSAPVEETPNYMQIVAMFDLSKVDGLKPSKTGPLVYFYGEGSDGQITEDRYGDKCRTYPVAEVLETVKKYSKGTPYYRRWKPAIAILESLTDFPGNAIECVVFGY